MGTVMTLSKDALKRRIDQALGRRPADLVIKGARILDVATGELLSGDVAMAGGVVVGICDEYEGTRTIDGRGAVVVPGFIDTHVHVESTCVTPDEFERCALPRGTTTAICDPHEIANVLGAAGLEYFLGAAERLTMDLRVQLSSCVPSTALETAGARLLAHDLLRYRHHPKVIGLAEFMSYADIFAHKDETLDKLVAFSGGHIDGHAPLVTGRELNAYTACGIRNCHESTRADEALEKMHKGLQVLIRDGSVSKDVDALAPLLTDRTSPFMAFCTDDRNPLDIAEEGHIDHLIRKSIARGAPIAAAYRAATWSAANGFGLGDRGRIAPGYRADLVLVDDLEACAVRTVLKDGAPVSDETFRRSSALPLIGQGSIKLDPVTADDFRIPAQGPTGPVIGIVPGSILTDRLELSLPIRSGYRESDQNLDVLKVAVFARHGVNRNVGRGFVKGFGLKSGALASSVGHDSHNVIVVGASDAEMTVAVNRLIEIQGGFVAVAGQSVAAELPLPVAGLMSDRPFEEVGRRLRALRQAVRELGCPLAEAFLQLAFLPLPVIPHLKITDRGLVDVDRLELIAA
jgi:adenine deaminase